MQTQRTEVTAAIAKKVLDVVDKGLCYGLGMPVPGQMCVEAAVCYALGEPHGDNPSCVGAAVRTYKIKINDSAWSNNTIRAEGMRAIAIAQLGSDTIDQVDFAKRMALKAVQVLVPVAMRAAAKAVPSHAAALETAAKACEIVTDLVSASAAGYAAGRAAGCAAGRAAGYAAGYAADAADAAGCAAGYAAGCAAGYAADYAAGYAAGAAGYAAGAAGYAAGAADAAGRAAGRNKVLKLAAEIAVDVLRDMSAPGITWLSLL